MKAQKGKKWMQINQFSYITGTYKILCNHFGKEFGSF